MTPKASSSPVVRMSPGQSIQARPWAFVGLAVVLGVVAGLALRMTNLRKAVTAYSVLRKLL